MLISSVHFSGAGGTREALKVTSGLNDQLFTKAEKGLLEKGLIGIGYAPDYPEKPIRDVSDRRHMTSEVEAFVIKEVLKCK